MEQLKKESDGSSLNIVESNIEQLKALFPEIVSEGKIDFEKLRETLGDAVETQEERYNFSWNGKALAKRIAQTKSTGTLKPCKAESKDWDSTQNLFIEGDNLEVLKLLQKSYHKQVKMIYIDPPYNTGNEFIYPDNFQDNLDTYLQYTHQKDDEGRKFGTNPDTSGRYHTNWLNMMYPRLRLAKNLLRDDGVIFISIDDNEVANLRKLCDEVFGEENFISNIIWRKKYGIQNDAKYFSVSHEYLVCITKNKLSFAPNLLERSEEQDNRYKNQDNDLRGPWKAENASVGRVTQKDMYEIITPSGRKVTPPEGRSWVVSKDKFQELLLDNRIWFGETGNNVPSIKKFLSEVRQGLTPTTFWDYDEVGHTDGSNKALKKLFDNSQYFDYPKPVDLIKRAIKLGSDDHGLVLDFFSGSATTAHSVMQLNVEDGGNRRFIMVQLPEPCTEKTEAYKAGYKTIADIGKERIRRAGEKILQDNAGIDNLDIGFKVFKLDSSNIKPWDADFDNLENTLLNIVDNIKEDRSEDDVLTEILLKYGLDLTVPVDSGFKDDVVKTNAIQILKQYGIDDVKSL
jgi:adenine-specific DNA-methyltransferase